MGNRISKKREQKNKRSSIAVKETLMNIDNKLLFDDNGEIDRVQVGHHMYRAIWGGNFLAPVRETLTKGGARVLDFGCGPGTWTCDMSSDFQKSIFVGIEVISLFPTVYPSNVQFIKCDLNGRLPFDNNQFDFVHIRIKILNYTTDQWRNIVLPELVRILKPGGWLEIFEIESKGINSGPILEKCLNNVRVAALKKDIDLDLVVRLPQMIVATVGVDPTTLGHVSKIVPMGSWGGKIGELMQNNFFELVRKVAIMFRMSEEEVEELLTKLQYEISTHKESFKLHRFYVMKSTNLTEFKII